MEAEDVAVFVVDHNPFLHDTDLTVATTLEKMATHGIGSHNITVELMQVQLTGTQLVQFQQHGRGITFPTTAPFHADTHFGTTMDGVVVVEVDAAHQLTIDQRRQLQTAIDKDAFACGTKGDDIVVELFNC